VPAEQRVQVAAEVAPVTAEYEPAGHCVHAELPAAAA